MKKKKQPVSHKQTRSANGRPTIGFLTGFRDQFFRLMWFGIADVAREHNINAICFAGNYVYDPQDFNAQANILYDLIDVEQLDGLVIWNLMCNLLDPDQTRQFYERYQSLPIVIIGGPMEGMTSIRADNYAGMREAIVHLVEVHGCRRLAFIKGLPGFETHEVRYQAYVDVLAEYGLPFDPARVAVPRDAAEMEQPDWGQVALRRLLDEQKADFDALVTNDDRFAHELLPELQARGIRVPGDVALVSFDNTEGSDCLTPPLTTVPIPMYKLGRQAAETLVAKLAGQKVLDQVVDVPSDRLIVRQSCGCLDSKVTQVVAGPVTRTSMRQPLDINLVKQRGNIVDEMIRTAEDSVSGLNAGWAEQLFDSLVAALSTNFGEEASPRFLSTLDEILRQMIAAEGDLEVWQQVLSTMRRQLLPYLSIDETRDRAEDLWLQAQMMIGEVGLRVQGYRGLQAERQKRILSQIGIILTTNFDVNVLADILAHELPRLGISRGYLSLYEHPQPYRYPQPVPEWSRLVLAYDENAPSGSKRVELEAGGRRFLSRQLVPEGILPQKEPYNLIVHALYFQNEQIGFMLLDGDQREGDVYELLRAQISSTIKGSLLIQDKIKADARLTHEAMHDPLTNLPNRRLFVNRLEHAIEWNKRHADDKFAVIYLDFDRFKIINDSLGHNVGDLFLVEMARRLRASVRAIDTVARMGGDEFAILLEAFKSDEEVFMIAERIQQNLAAPFVGGGNSIVTTASLGIVMNLLKHERLEDILRDADIAMYNAKVNGRNRYKVFDISMRKEAEGILKLENELRHAIENDEFRLHYQPILSLKTQQITGFEALIRWQHPERGFLYPGDFIKNAEESRLIVPIGQWVLHEACRQMKEWQTQSNMDPPLTISVNVSSQEFALTDLPQKIEKILQETGLPARSLRLELTETTLIDDIETAGTKIEHLQSLGVEVEIDDFGTGYSSLGYLRHLPVNNLKIDSSFVNTLGINKSGIPIIRAIIAMANSLDMKVIAEGIETKVQMENLIQMNCDYGQGYLFDKPMDVSTAQKLINEMLSKQMD